MAHLLGGESLTLSYPNRVVIDDVTIGVNEGDRIGVVGRNGDGKSTLLKLLSGVIEPDEGRVTRRGGVTVGVLAQTDSLDDDGTIAEAVVGDTPEYEWAGNRIVRDVISGLLGGLDWHGRIGDLSGGQRRRVALAALLAGDWDVLFLDEPTNHLDLEGVHWLAQHLNQRWARNSGGLLVVTHDRWFLDEISTMTWEVHDGIVDIFEGGYAAYVLQRVERDRMASVTEAKRQNLMKKELAWLRRGAPARTAKPKFRIEAANQLIEDVPPVRDKIQLSSMAMSRIGKEVVNLVDAGVSYGDHHVLHDVNWKLAPGERTGILGVNGAGKSTLLGLISGAVTPTEGSVKRGTTVKIAQLTQHFELLEDVMHERVSDVIGRKRTSYSVGGKEMSPGQLLERMGFTNAQLSTPVKDLSGGQKRRLQLLLILLDEPNVLILDEPSNDMDTDMLAAIEDLLDSWPGTLIVVSHDRYLLERVTDQQYAVLGGTLRHLPGGVDEYLKLSEEEQAGVGQSGAAPTGSPTRADADAAPAPAASTPGSELSGAERRALEKEVSAAERKIAKLDAEIQQLHAKMAAHDQTDYTGLGEITAKIQALGDDIAETEERWLEASDRLGN